MEKRKKITPVDILIGRRIQEARQALNINQSELGAVLVPPVSFQQIGKHERGINRISAANLYLLSIKLGRSMDWFFIEGNENVGSSKQP